MGVQPSQTLPWLEHALKFVQAEISSNQDTPYNDQRYQQGCHDGFNHVSRSKYQLRQMNLIKCHAFRSSFYIPQNSFHLTPDAESVVI
jgi:hypothetical protein